MLSIKTVTLICVWEVKLCRFHLKCWLHQYVIAIAFIFSQNLAANVCDNKPAGGALGVCYLVLLLNWNESRAFQSMFAEVSSPGEQLLDINPMEIICAVRRGPYVAVANAVCQFLVACYNAKVHIKGQYVLNM